MKHLKKTLLSLILFLCLCTATLSTASEATNTDAPISTCEVEGPFDDDDRQ